MGIGAAVIRFGGGPGEDAEAGEDQNGKQKSAHDENSLDGIPLNYTLASGDWMICIQVALLDEKWRATRAYPRIF